MSNKLDKDLPEIQEDSTAQKSTEKTEKTAAEKPKRARKPRVKKQSTEIVLADDMLPTTIYVLPLTERPFFPPQVIPIMLQESVWLDTIELALKKQNGNLGLLLANKDSPNDTSIDDFYTYGTITRIHQPTRDGDRLQFIVQGIKRFRVVRWLTTEAPFQAEIEYCDDTVFSNTDELRAYSMAVINALKEILPLNPLYSEELHHFLSRFNTNDPSALADFATYLTTASKQELQEVLEIVPILERMQKVVGLIHKELEVARLQSKIRSQVDEKINEQQRNFFLREQLKIIQQELGLSKDDRSADLERFESRLVKKTLPPAIEKRIEEEFDKFSVLEPGSPEYGLTRNYLDTLTDLPWGLHAKEKLNLTHARRVLNRDHDGLNDVKDRILEFIALGKLSGQVKGSIILLVGPPGVGKTSIGRSIANALGRPYYRFSVGGARDEAEIKGHRRTYIGSMPGKLIQALRTTQTMNPVILLDEIDKMGSSYHGDPASALLEVLDPEQNRDFLDHYLDERVDLSQVLFVCTANTLDLPDALLDRMEVIRLSGYIAEEKRGIARKHLWPRLLEKANLTTKQVQLSDGALRFIIDGYAREAGVRQLEKQLARLVRKVATEMVMQMDKEKLTELPEPVLIKQKEVEKYLGKPIFQQEENFQGVGIATGLAWTSMGGVTLNLEVTRVHNKTRGYKVSGQLGDVMKESAELAYSYVNAHLADYGVDKLFFDDAMIHIHAPEGATPKDGPSAGITMATAILSLALDRAPTKGFAMTGELTLTGKVLAIGGVREKLVAARRVGMKQIIFPDANQHDFEDLPDYLKEGITPHFVKTYEQVAALMFPKD